MKLAVRKETGSVPGGGYHYMLMPFRLDGDQAIADPAIMELTGHVIIDVADDVGERLLKSAGAALQHQYEVAILTEQEIKKAKP